MEEIPVELILNLYGTDTELGSKCFHHLVGPWISKVRSGSKFVEWTTREASLLFFVCVSYRRFPSLKVIYEGKTNRCHPKFPLSWLITYAPKHWSTEQYYST